MAQGIEKIGKKDILWSYAATIFMVGAGVILMPFILNMWSDATVGLWTNFQTITSLVLLLDFGFRPSFARNVSYIFSGVKNLQKEGVVGVEEGDVDYSLLKGTLKAMRKFYSYTALAVFVLLLTVGTAYFYYLIYVKGYAGNHTDAIVGWLLLIAINCYTLYTLYYDALLLGKGYVKRNQQITILGQAVYLLTAVGLIYAGFGISAIVSAQLLSTIIRRVLTYKVFFTKDIESRLREVEARDSKEIIRAVYPNAIKSGLTNLGGFAVNKSAVFLGSIFLSLEEVAVYGITMQVMEVLGRCGAVTYQSYVPKLAKCRAEKDLVELRRLYTYSILALIAVYVAGGTMFVTLGDWALGLIHSKTGFLPMVMLIVAIVISFLEHNHAIAAGFIMADNKIPFFIPSLVSGAATILLLWLFLGVADWGLWGMVLAPGLAQLAYQNWKWPSVLIREITQKK